MQATWFGQYKIMIWKAVLLKRRNKKSTIWEFILPIYFIAILAVIRLTSQQDGLPQFGNFPSYSIYDSRFLLPEGQRVIVTPDTAEVRSLMADIKQLFESSTNLTLKVEYKANSSEAESEYINNGSNIFAGIIFEYTPGSNYSYALRFADGAIPGTDYGSMYATQGNCRHKVDGIQSNDEGLQHDWQCKVNYYLFKKFSQLQVAIETILIRKKLGLASFPVSNVSVQMLPKPAFLQDSTYIQIISSIYFVIAYSPLINMLTVALVSEKEKKIKEGMKMMGLSSSVFWLSWGTVYTVMIIIITTIVTVIAYAAKFYKNSNMFLFFLLLFLYGMSIISLSCLITPFFNKAQAAGGLASFGTMIISCLYLIVSLTRKYEEGTGSVSYTVPVYGRWLLSLLSPVALSLGIDQSIYLDLRGGMTMETARQGEFPLYGPVIMLILDSALYFTLAVYFDNVIPGEYGPRYKPWFIFTKAFWCPSGSTDRLLATYNNQVFLDVERQTSVVHESSDVEPVSARMESKVAVSIQNLTKEFPDKEKKNEKIKAVNGLSLNIYEDQITAILGHNGAGKTTLLNILTGMTGPTSGSAMVLGKDVSDAGDMSQIRRVTGVCPQHNILFDELTCLEHLRLFAGIKGVPDSQVDQAINEALDSVGLKDQKNTRSAKLSGGQKRKLSVAIAIIGDPKIIFLDEPSAGMDPYSRRHLWAVLKEKKKGRIIILTTHFMDEADILADRKAIINKGKLRCCGSSLFLKNRFGLGYHLNMVVEPNCDTAKVTATVARIVEGSEVNRVHGKELDITMPHTGVNKFSELFAVLENQSTAKSLGVKNFGVSMTTLEEVFLRLEEDIDIELADVSSELDDKTNLLSPRNGKYGTNSKVDMRNEPNPSDTIRCLQGHDLYIQRLRALFIIRGKKLIRAGATIVTGMLIPVAMVILGLVLSKTLQQGTAQSLQQAPLQLQPSLYAKLLSGYGQYFPYNTIPKLLLRDTVKSALSQSMVANISAVFETTTNLTADYFNGTFKLLDKKISPHYLGVQFESLSQTAQGIDASYKVMYNDSAVHSIPATITMMSNMLMYGAQAIFQGSIDTNNSIQLFSLPWPKLNAGKVYNSAAFTMTLIIGMAFSILPGNFGVDIVKDRQLKVRSQLRVSGVPFSLYWLSYFLVNLVQFMIPVILLIIVVFVAQVDSLMPSGAVLSFLLTAFTYVPANIWFAYFVSFVFDKYETCQSLQPMLFMMMGYIPYIPVSIVDMTGDSRVATVMHYIFCFIFPTYNIFGSLYYTDKIYQSALLLNMENDITFGDYFQMSSNIPICYIFSVVHIFLFFFLLRVLDIYKTGGDIREACMPGKSQSTVIPAANHDNIDYEDEDVAAERERVAMLRKKPAAELPVAIAENLRKEFRTDKTKRKNCRKVSTEETVKIAVRNQTFAVECGEVFGLLGPNGAGKTTTLNMMIADVSPDKGKVIIGGFDIRSSMSEAFQAMGYCPQHDALWDEVTLQEHLDCYARIRGIPADQVQKVIDFFIDNLNLGEHKDKRAKKLSGGTKRKVCYCMSMLGRPRVVLLDEPSTGMDPQSKRFLWDTISSSFENSERGAILTTHYMEEADALCSRIAIMVNGNMECIGSGQHLKSKYGSGYLLEVKLKVNEANEDALGPKMEHLHGYIRQLFPDCVVMEQFSERVQYKIPKSNVDSLATTFTMLEQGKKDYDISEYSFSQSTLEQVFLEFAKKQLEEGQTEQDPEANSKGLVMRSLSQNRSPQHFSSERL